MITPEKSGDPAKIIAIYWCIAATLAQNIPETAHTVVQSAAG
jgi:hypothetical protein